MDYLKGLRVEHLTKYGLGVVNSVEDDRVRIKFDNFEDIVVMLLSAPHIQASDAPPPMNKKTPRKDKYPIDDKIVEWIKLKGCYIFVESKSANIAALCDAYLAETGEILPSDSSHICIQENRPICPVEWRVQFDPPGFYSEYPHEDNHFVNKWRISRKAFIFELFANGFRIGNNKGKDIALCSTYSNLL
jgi:hypothetical protein